MILKLQSCKSVILRFSQVHHFTTSKSRVLVSTLAYNVHLPVVTKICLTDADFDQEM